MDACTGGAFCDQDPLTIDQFRALFPAFADDTTFPDLMIQTWLDLAPVNPCVWGDRYQLGQGLWAAHELAKFGPGGLVSNGTGGIGIPASKAVNGVSVSYDLSLGKMEDAGPYNLTLYGQQFWKFAKLVGAGVIPMQIGAATPSPSGVPGHYGAWPGPWPFPSASGFSS